MEELLATMRAAGWHVGCFNEYFERNPLRGGRWRSFWLFTHGNGIFVKGEADTDLEALAECKAKALRQTPDAFGGG